MLNSNWVHYPRVWGGGAAANKTKELKRGEDDFTGDVVLYPQGHKGIFQGIYYLDENEDEDGFNGVSPNSFGRSSWLQGTFRPNVRLRRQSSESDHGVRLLARHRPVG